MKKIYLLLLTVFSAFLMNAQTILTVGAGTAVSATTDNGNPIYRSSPTSSFGWAISGHVYTASQLSAIPAGSTITAVAFKKTSAFGTATGKTAAFNIYMNNSSLTALSTTTTRATVQGLTNVYTNAAQAIPATTGFLTFTLGTPFVYTGGSLEVYLDWNIGAQASSGISTGAFLWEYSTGNVAQTIGTSTSAATTAATVLGSAQARSYNAQFTYTAGTACSGTPTAGTITASSTVCSGSIVSLSNSGATAASGITYQWQQSTDNGTTWGNVVGGLGATSSSYTTPALTVTTQYRLVVTCTNSALSATTAATTITINNPTYAGIPYTEDFESWINGCGTSDVPSNNWRNAPISGNNSWRRDDQGTTAAWGNPTFGAYTPVFTTGAHSARFHAYQAAGASVGNLDFYVNCSTTSGTSQLSFDFILNSTSAASLGVFVSTDGGTTFTQQGTNLALSTTWVNKLFTITSSSATTVIRLKAISDFGNDDIGIDNFKIVPPPSCLAPTASSSSIISATSASHIWTAPSPAPASGYEWVVSTSNTPPASGTATTGLTANSTGLTANTTYYLHVRSNCGTGFSTWFTSSFYTGYCIPAPTSVDGSGITNVTFGTINNTTVAEAGNYGDYTAQVSIHDQGSTVPVSITYATGFTYGTKIWIDFNDNLSFNDPGEQVYYGLSTNVNPTTLAASISIPGSAPLGVHRLRIGGTDIDLGPTDACYSGTYGTFEDYSIQINIGNPCTGAPTGVVITPASTTACGTGAANLSATTTSTGTGITYAWQSSPAGANTFTAISGATTNTYAATGVTSSTDYRCILTCSGSSTTSATATITVSSAPSNDEACAAITLVLDGASDCGNTTCATSVADPVFSNSTANNTVWYKYTPTVTGAVIITMARPTGVTTGLLNGWVALYTATGTCPAALTFTELTPALAAFDLPTTATVSATTPSLTAGTTYYFMVDGVSGAFGAYCISIQSPPPPPNCTTNITPADMATNVTISPSVSLSWNAAATATSYDLYYGTTNPPTTLLGNTALTAIGVTGSSSNTIYYWYVVPKNAGGTAVGCVSNVTSFTTTNICTPTTTNGGTSSDALVDFVLNGEGSTAISVLGAAPIAAPGYIDLTASTTVDLAAGKAYAGNFKVQSSVDNLTIWIDYNNNNSFEASEMVLNNLNPISLNTTSPYSILINPSATVGTHKMRVRNIYNAVGPVDPCGGYTYGEGKDFTVNIVAIGTPYTVSNVGAGACASVAKTTIDAFSNNNNIQVPLLDANGAIVAQINANGNSLGTVTSSVYRNTGAVRQAISYYLDRNVTITPATQPTTAVDVRLYYTAAELAALQAVDNTVTSVNLTSSKTPAVCSNVFSGVQTLLAHNGDGTLGADYYLNLQVSSFSSFYMKNGAAVLPNGDIISGKKQGTSNLIDWKISCTTSPSVDITLERSADNRNFKALDQQNATAARCDQNFTYIDASPLVGINYYRVKMVTPQGSVRYTSIVALLSATKGFELISLAPNPVKNMATLSISSAKAGKIEMSVVDFAGKTLSKEQVTVIAGNNPITMNLAALAAGTYTIVARNADGELKTTRFVKY